MAKKPIDYGELDNALRGLALAIEGILGDYFEGLGFALLVVEFGEDAGANYISNIDRADMIEILRKTADRLEQRRDIPPPCGLVH